MTRDSKTQNVHTTTEPLGGQLIEGLTTEGKRITSESLQNNPGCEKNVSTAESWYSPELWMTLVLKTSGCLMESNTRLEKSDERSQIRAYSAFRLITFWSNRNGISRRLYPHHP